MNDRLTLDFKLDVGELTESVVVTAESPMLESATASIGMVVDERRATELPIAGGNGSILSRLSAGVTMTAGHGPGNPRHGHGLRQVIVNGTRSGSSDVTLDGAPEHVRGTGVRPLRRRGPGAGIQDPDVTFDASLGHARRRGGQREHPDGHQQAERHRLLHRFARAIRALVLQPLAMGPHHRPRHAGKARRAQSRLAVPQVGRDGYRPGVLPQGLRRQEPHVLELRL